MARVNKQNVSTVGKKEQFVGTTSNGTLQYETGGLSLEINRFQNTGALDK